MRAASRERRYSMPWMRTVRSDMNGRNDCGFRSQIVAVIVAPARDARLDVHSGAT